MNPLYHHRKHSALSEAVQTIYLFRPWIEKVVHLVQQLHFIGYNIFRYKYSGGMGPNGDLEHPFERDRLISILKEFDASGVMVAGMEETYLCCTLGEKTI